MKFEVSDDQRGTPSLSTKHGGEGKEIWQEIEEGSVLCGMYGCFSNDKLRTITSLGFYVYKKPIYS
jgi:hypothetical protein